MAARGRAARRSAPDGALDSGAGREPEREVGRTETRQFLTAASIVVVGSVGSKILGFVRESAMAAVFGASALTDAYLVGSTVPNLIVGTVVGALATSFIPVYVQERQRDVRAAGRLAADLFLFMVLVGAGAGLAVLAWARPLCRFLAPDFPPSTFALAARTAVMLAPLPVLLGVNALGTSLLQSHYRFGAPALSGICQNVVLIAGILTLGRWWGIEGVAVGLVLGTAAQWAALGPGARGLGITWPGAFWRSPGVRRILVLALPLIGGGLIGQVAPVIQRILASGLPAGSLSALNYATLLQGLPTGLTTAALGTVLYPAFANRTAHSDLDGLRSLLQRGINISVLLVLPVTVGSVLLSVPLVRVAFERGAFDAADTAATAAAFWFLAWSMLPMVLADLWRRAFYALQETTFPTLVGVLGMGITVVLSLLSVGRLAHAGLALAVAATNVTTAFLLLWRLHKRLHHLGGREMLDRLFKAGTGAAVMGGVVRGLDVWSWHWMLARGAPAGSALMEAARLAGVVAVGAVVYLVWLWATGVPEMRQAGRLGWRVARATWRRVGLGLARR